MDHNKIIQKLCKAGFQSYLVGGAVRDFFAGQEPHDFDITTKATPEDIAKVFSGFRVDLVGKAFGVSLVEGFEVATFRVDSYPEQNGAKNCIPHFANTIEEDLSRRDLTINALALCPISGECVDLFNGVNDLKNGIIRFVGNADERIAEDPCRILRACRFLSKLQGTFDVDTLQALQRNVHRVASIDVERIADEVRKAMETPQPSIFFSALQVIGALDIIFPGFGAAVDHPHGNHHLETVWEHSLLAGDAVSSRFPLVRLAAFLHDAGKPYCYKRNADGTFSGHEAAGRDQVASWLKRLKFSNQDRETVVNLVYTHMIGGYKSMSPKAVRKFRKTLADLNVNPSDWIRIRIADRNANISKDTFTISEIRGLLSLFDDTGVEPVFNVNSLALKGGDIIRIFNLQPSKIVGDIQKHLLEFVVEEGFEFNTVEVLTVEAERFLRDKKVVN